MSEGHLFSSRVSIKLLVAVSVFKLIYIHHNTQLISGRGIYESFKFDPQCGKNVSYIHIVSVTK